MENTNKYEKGKISVVIPTYNQVNFIAETLESVINQTYTNLEIIVSDDHSTDGTIDVIKQFAQRDSRVKPILSEENVGISKNFNKAFDAVTGEFVAFLGGDDIMYPLKLEKQIAVLNEHAEVALVLHKTEVFDSDTGELIFVHGKQRPLPTDPLNWVFATEWFFYRQNSSVLPSACLARSSYYLHARYDTRLYYKHELLFTLDDYMADRKAKWFAIQEILGKYRFHSNNFSRKEDNTRTVNEESLVLYGIAMIRYPEISNRINSYKDFLLFRMIMRNWIPQEKKWTYIRQFYHEAGIIKFLYLMLVLFAKYLVALYSKIRKR